MKKRVKVLLATLGLDVHNRGIMTVSIMLRDAGMEVIYMGNALPEEIVKVAIQEDVDVIGASSLGGAHLSLGGELIEFIQKENIMDRIVLEIGGVFPPNDAKKLQEMGFDNVFTPGATSKEIISAIRKSLSNKITK
jgi:methylmalonyl-CoA mutase C-terminal domain/subunit